MGRTRQHHPYRLLNSHAGATVIHWEKRPRGNQPRWWSGSRLRNEASISELEHFGSEPGEPRSLRGNDFVDNRRHTHSRTSHCLRSAQTTQPDRTLERIDVSQTNAARPIRLSSARFDSFDAQQMSLEN